MDILKPVARALIPLFLSFSILRFSTPLMSEEYGRDGKRVYIREKEGVLTLHTSLGYGYSDKAKHGFSSFFASSWRIGVIKGFSLSPTISFSAGYYNNDLSLEAGEMKIEKVPLFSGAGLDMEERLGRFTLRLTLIPGSTLFIQRTIQKWEGGDREGWRGIFEWSLLTGLGIGYYYSELDRVQLQIMYDYNKRDTLLMLYLCGSRDVGISLSN